MCTDTVPDIPLLIHQRYFPIFPSNSVYIFFSKRRNRFHSSFFSFHRGFVGFFFLHPSSCTTHAFYITCKKKLFYRTFVVHCIYIQYVRVVRNVAIFFYFFLLLYKTIDLDIHKTIRFFFSNIFVKFSV